MTGVLSFVTVVVFIGLLLIGAISTTARVIRYHRAGLKQPVLLGRDRDLLIGLAVPIVAILTVRAFDLGALVSNAEGPHLWYLLLTGLPPIYALARYDWYEIAVIDRGAPTLDERSTVAVERLADATERIADSDENGP